MVTRICVQRLGTGSVAGSKDNCHQTSGSESPWKIRKWPDQRIPELLKIPAKVRLSLGRTHARADLASPPSHENMQPANLPKEKGKPCPECKDDQGVVQLINWVIFGGESGPNARPATSDGFVRASSNASATGVPVFVKQLGAKPVCEHGKSAFCTECFALIVTTKKAATSLNGPWICASGSFPRWPHVDLQGPIQIVLALWAQACRANGWTAGMA